MKSMRFALFFLTVLLTATSCTQAQKTNGAKKIYGDWTGESICANKEKFPACKDETVVFRFSKSTTDANLVHVAAYKIVNGAEDLMGENDLTYHSANNMLSGEIKVNQNLTLQQEFQINGDRMQGTLKQLPEKTLIRNISLTRRK